MKLKKFSEWLKNVDLALQLLAKTKSLEPFTLKALGIFLLFFASEDKYIISLKYYIVKLFKRFNIYFTTLLHNFLSKGKRGVVSNYIMYSILTNRLDIYII